MGFKVSEIKQINEIIDDTFIKLKKVSPKVKAFLEQGGEIRARNQIKKITRADENFSRAIFRFKIRTPENLEEYQSLCEDTFLSNGNCRSWELPSEKCKELFRDFNNLKPNTEYWVKGFRILSSSEYKHCKGFITKQPHYIYGGACGLFLIKKEKLPEGFFITVDKEECLLYAEGDKNLLPRQKIKKTKKDQNKEEDVLLLPRLDIYKDKSCKYLFHPTTKEGISKGFVLICFYSMKEKI